MKDIVPTEVTLPPIIPASELPELTLDKVDADTSESDVITADAKVMSFNLATVAYAVRAATTADEICKLALTSAKLLESRRNLLCKPYGYKDTSKHGAFTLTPD